MKKVLIYFVLTLILMFEKANGQIVYTDINPDSTISASETEIIKSYFIDMDNNGIYEIELRHFNPNPENVDVEIHINPDIRPQVIINPDFHLKVIQLNEEIGLYSLQWGSDQYGILNSSWYGDPDKFIGVRFNINNKKHYGWIRVNIPEDHNSFTVKDYAYNSEPNKSILAGQMYNSSIYNPLENSNPILCYFTDPFNIHLKINTKQAEVISLKIIDLMGKEVLLLNNISGNEVSISRNNLNEGIYLLVIYNQKEAIVTEKIIIRNN